MRSPATSTETPMPSYSPHAKSVATYLKEVVHGEGHLQTGVVTGFHNDVVGDEVRAQHETEGDQGSLLLGLAS